MKTENLSTLKIHKMTQAQYERELAAGRIDENALYLTPDVLPDWNQNDETASDYIKNRPFYIEEVEITEILPITEFVGEDENGDGSYDDFYLFNTVEGVELGKTYTVNYNGTDYECTAQEMAEDITFIVLGNMSYAGGEDTGEPFMLALLPPETASQMGVGGIGIPLDGSSSFTASIIGMKESIKKLDNKFLDLGWVPSKSKVKSVLFSEYVSFNSSGSKTYTRILFDIILGEEYEVSWNGETYICEPKTFVYNNVPYSSIGNLSLGEFGDDTGEPFLFYVLRMDDTTGYTFINTTAKGSSVDIIVKGPEYIYNKMPKDFMPDTVDNLRIINSLTLVDPDGTNVSMHALPGNGVYFPGNISIQGQLAATQTYVDTNLSSHTSNADIHVTIDEKAKLAAIDATKKLATEDYVETKVADLVNSAPETLNTLGEIATAIEEHQDVTDALNAAIGNKANASDLTSHISDTSIHMISAEKTKLAGIADNATAVGQSTTGKTYTIDGASVTAETGAEIFNNYTSNKASGSYSHAEGYITTASGSRSHAEGYRTNAKGNNSHTEGGSTTASGESAHAEGTDTTASSLAAHAEGRNTIASGAYAHSEGYNTNATGEASHVEGIGTKASRMYQHVQGKYNIPDSNAYPGIYAHIVGNGTADDARSNAHTLDWSGNAWYQGNIKVGGTSQDDETSVFVLTENDIATDEDTMDFLVEMDLIELVAASDGSIYTNKDEEIYTL